MNITLETDHEVEVHDQDGNNIPFEVSGGYEITVTIDTKELRKQILRDFLDEVRRKILND